jgi:hypothetical protein
VNFQFIVKVAGVQSASTSPSRAAIPSLTRFAGPDTRRLCPGGVRKIVWIRKLRIPRPKCEITQSDTSSWNRRRIEVSSSPPSQDALNATGQSSSQPSWLASESGRQR